MRKRHRLDVEKHKFEQERHEWDRQKHADEARFEEHRLVLRDRDQLFKERQ